jgi:hypothetical protein
VRGGGRVATGGHWPDKDKRKQCRRMRLNSEKNRVEEEMLAAKH